MTDKERQEFRSDVENACRFADIPFTPEARTVELLFGYSDKDGIRNGGLEEWLRQKGCRIEVEESAPGEFWASWLVPSGHKPSAVASTEALARAGAAWNASRWLVEESWRYD